MNSKISQPLTFVYPLLELPSPSPANLFRPDFRPFPCLLPVNLRLLYQLLVLIISLFKYFVHFLAFFSVFRCRPAQSQLHATPLVVFHIPPRCSAHFFGLIVKLAPPTERWLAYSAGRGGDLVKFVGGFLSREVLVGVKLTWGCCPPQQVNFTF